jgi:hypothetical protein
MSFSTSFLIPSQLTRASRIHVPRSLSSVSLLLSSSACRADAFAATLAAGLNVNRLGDSDGYGSGDSYLLLSLLLLSDACAAAAAAAATFAAANCNVRLGDSGGSCCCDCPLLLLLLLLSGNETGAFLCGPCGCQHLPLWPESSFLCFNVPILHGMLKRPVPVGKAALLESVPYFSILERRTCRDHVESSHKNSHCIGLAYIS